MSWQDVRSFYEDPEDYEPDWRTLRQSTHTARLTHTCDLCGGIVQIGQRYEVMVALDEGEFKIWRHHTQGQCLSQEEQEAIERHIAECEQLNWEQQWADLEEDADWYSRRER